MSSSRRSHHKKEQPHRWFWIFQTSAPAPAPASHRKLASAGLRHMSEDKGFFHRNIPDWLQRSSMLSSSPVDSPISSDESNTFLQGKRMKGSLSYSPVPEMNMNEYPQIPQIRMIIICLCFVCFFVAPGVYMPLGKIQAAYQQHCFFYSTLKVTTVRQGNMTGAFLFDSLASDWGPIFYCHVTTYTPVSVAICSIFIGWSTLQIWPEMMSLGRGGLLALLYTIATLCLFSTCIFASGYIREGHHVTCTNLMKEYLVPCKAFDGLIVKMRNMDGIIGDLSQTMLFVEVASWCLTGLVGSMMLLSAYAFGIIWFYCYFDNPWTFYASGSFSGAPDHSSLKRSKKAIQCSNRKLY